MPTGGTHLFSVPAVSYSSVSSSPITSRVNVVSPITVKSSFSAFVRDWYTSKGDVKLWNNPFFSVPCLLCHDAPVGDWFFCACGRARPSSTGFPSISTSSCTLPTYISSVLSSVLSCENRFSVLSAESLYDDPLNLGFDDVPVVPRRKRHCISAARISPIVPESRKPDLAYEPCTANLDLGDKLLVKLLSPHAKKPTRGSESTARYDFYCAENTPVIIPSRTRKLVDTSIAIATPGAHLYATIAPGSGLSIKGLDIGAGVIDVDYRGSVKVLLINSGDTPFQINPGD